MILNVYLLKFIVLIFLDTIIVINNRLFKDYSGIYFSGKIAVTRRSEYAI